MFSSDFTDSELGDKLQGLASAPALLMMGGADQYVPQTVVVPGGKHNLEGSEREAVALVADFLSGV